METIKDFKLKYKCIRKTSGVYKGDFRDVIEKLPEFYYQKFLFDTETKIYYIAFSLLPIEGFFEKRSSQIKEPSVSFVDMIRSL